MIIKLKELAKSVDNKIDLAESILKEAFSEAK